MSEKSSAAIGVHNCPVCGENHGKEVLLHRMMKAVLEKEVLTGVSLCPKCRANVPAGYVVAIGIDPSKTILGESVTRTGCVAYIRRTALENLFGSEAAASYGGWQFLPQPTIETLAQIAKGTEESNDQSREGESSEGCADVAGEEHGPDDRGTGQVGGAV